MHSAKMEIKLPNWEAWCGLVRIKTVPALFTQFKEEQDFIWPREE